MSMKTLAGGPGLRRIGAIALVMTGGLWLAGLDAHAQAARAPAKADAARNATAYRTLNWEDLIPKGWDPMAPFRERNLLTIREGSAAEREMMKELREVWDQAPTRNDLNGQALRLPGYVVPLDQVGDKLKEFLLVPYFGACIHSPPPPANQIVHVSLKKPAALRTMDVVWVSGTLGLDRQDTGMGVSGYSLQADAVEPYRAEPKTERTDKTDKR